MQINSIRCIIFEGFGNFYVGNPTWGGGGGGKCMNIRCLGGWFDEVLTGAASLSLFLYLEWRAQAPLTPTHRDVHKELCHSVLSGVAILS